MKHNWEYKRLGEVCDKGASNLMQKKLEITDSGFDVFGASGCLGKIGFYQQENQYIGIVKDGSGVGRCNLYPAKTSLIGTMQYILAKDLVTNGYLYYVLRSLNLAKYANGAAIPHIYFRDYKKEIVPVPPLSVQEQIVGELDKINELIDDCRELLRTLDNLAQSIFYDSFGDPVTNPKGWIQQTVKDISTVKIGPFGSLLHKEDYISGGTPLVNPIHMQGGFVRIDNNFTIDETKKQSLLNYLLKSDDIVFGRRGDIGRCALITAKEDGYLCGTGSLFVRFKIKINPIFALWCFKQESVIKYLTDKAKGATMLNINCGIVESIPLILPPLTLQEDFAKRIEAIEAIKATTQQQLAALQTLLDSRMDYWFN